MKINATVIPAPRKSVKRMMFEAMVGFLSRLCFASDEDPPMYEESVSADMDRATRRKNKNDNKRIYATTDHHALILPDKVHLSSNDEYDANR
ncbi:unnamed protein product [Sphenostylis stenocarpa]|uniref:Uncharacterized protein n=1 Tax=Sphenostylis stenocarpa TaxID=92480 RepID=A0AA86VKR2_9FABA|nr:unnamed protein product [Sphenostylis stenocarpa]